MNFNDLTVWNYVFGLKKLTFLISDTDTKMNMKLI